MNKIIGAAGAAALALTMMAGAAPASAHEHGGGHEIHNGWHDGFEHGRGHERGWDHGWRGGPIIIAPATRDMCTVKDSWNNLVQQDTWPYPTMSYELRQDCSNGFRFQDGYTFYHQQVW